MGDSVTVGGAGGPVTAVPVASTTATSSPSAFASARWPIPATSTACLKRASSNCANLDLWIVDALRPQPHPSHWSLPEALEWIERLQPKRAILTNMHTDMDYATLKAQLPPHIEPAYDGMRLEIVADLSDRDTCDNKTSRIPKAYDIEAG